MSRRRHHKTSVPLRCAQWIPTRMSDPRWVRIDWYGTRRGIRLRHLRLRLDNGCASR